MLSFPKYSNFYEEKWHLLEGEKAEICGRVWGNYSKELSDIIT